ncbi:MAG: glycoside hydrolase family 2 TIM barrel-domain containing protein [Bacteroidales bacterium]
MKYITILLSGFLLFSACNRNNTPIDERINIDFDWQFTLNNPDMDSSIVLNTKNSVAVDLPHDWSVEGVPEKENPSGKDGGYYPGGIGWYQKTIDWDNSWKDKLVEITFDGIYMNSDVWINGQHLGNRPNGYIGITYELSQYLVKGTNTITVKVDNSKQPNARWYTGSGIYRHVWLQVKNKVHIPASGVYVSFSSVDSTCAKMNSVIDVKNSTGIDKKILLETKLYGPNRLLVGEVHDELLVKANSTCASSQIIEVKNPLLWSPENPVLYKLVASVKEANTIISKSETNTGIRALKFDAQTGFCLNGRNIKIKGVCMHHDAGSIGAAVPDDVWARRIRLLKEMGCNAIRTSHNPFSPEFYDMCDSMGMMVMNEAFDGWATPKAKFDYGVFFNEWWKADLTDFVLRDRNHPSIIMWSIGNEVRGRTDSVESLLYNTIKALDNTRPVTIGAGHDAKIVDVAGFNGIGEFPGYLEKVHEKHPDWQIIGTEMPHSWQTRGIYRTKTWWRGRDFPAPWAPKQLNQEPTEGSYFPIPDLTAEEVFTNIDSNYLSSYDNATVRISAREQWKRTVKFDWLMGEFRWTGFDYMGENIWPNRGWHCGALDLAGFKKDLYYFYQSVWTKKPMVHILPHWTHHGKEGVEIPVIVYSNCSEVELFLNGKSLGAKKDTLNNLQFLWYVPYEKGEIKAVAKTGKGEVITSMHKTASQPYALQLNSDKSQMCANARSLAHITVKVVDESGNFVPDANIPFTYEITGSAKLLGIENGDMLDLSSGKANTKTTFNGLSLMYIQSTDEQGIIEVNVKSDGLKDGNIKLKTFSDDDTEAT